MSLSITAVARQTGVPTSTLRYYDRLGLLASSGRADNGYRQYDERALDRLRFIGRAKDLGCSLDEIASILVAFDDDCGDVQAPLRDLVGHKISIAQRRVAELVALTAQLQEARHALAGQAAKGPCGPGCACLVGTAPAREGRRQLSVVELAPAAPEISCTLDHEHMVDRVADWQAALVGVRERYAVDGGVRLVFALDADIVEVARLARAEWACCSFFEFTLTVDGRGAALEVRAPAAAQPVLTSLFGAVA